MFIAVCLSDSTPISLIALVRGLKLDNGHFVDGLPSFTETKR